MKYLSSLIITISSSMLSFLVPNQSLPDIIEPTPTPEVNQVAFVSFQNYNYAVYWFSPEKTDTISLHENLSSSLTAQEAYKTHQCTYLINGGFYSTDNKPIGWFKTETDEISPVRSNRLFNAYLLSTKDSLIKISTDIADTSTATFGFQTGPLLYLDQVSQSLNLIQDKPARRSFALIDDNEKVYLGMITSVDSAYSGPFLKNMGQILDIFAQQTNIDIKDAINLDGGSASAYITPEISLSEINPIGSYLCIYR